MVKYYNFMLDYEKDELEQLEKMYEADDLTEETEEIVLKRQRNSRRVRRVQPGKRQAQPRRNAQSLACRATTSPSRNRWNGPRWRWPAQRWRSSLDLNRARYELEQRKKARTKSLDRHAKLLEDRGLMEIKSPADGIVFYGQSVNGRWSETPSLINKYKPKATCRPARS